MATDTSESIALVLGETHAHSMDLKAEGDEDGTILEVLWEGIPNRDPSASGDFVALWQNNGVIPFGTAPQSKQPVTGLTPDGDMAFTELQLASLPYAVGYSVGPDATNYYEIAAAVYIQPGGSTESESTRVNVGPVGRTSVIVNYSVPAGIEPKNFGHRIVLVEGPTYKPTSPPTPLAIAEPGNRSKDAVAFNGVTMVKGEIYTAAYLMGYDTSKKQVTPTTVAATVTFTVASS